MASKPKRKRMAGRATRKGAPPATTVAQVRLGPSALIGDASQLHLQLLPLLDNAAPVAIDAGSVERVDTAVLQLLHAFGKERQARGRSLEWLAASNPLRAAAASLGLALHGLVAS